MKFYFAGTGEHIYRKDVKPPKYSATMQLVRLDRLNAGKYLALSLPQFTKSDHLRAAAHYRDEARLMKKEWEKTADRAARKAFGRPFEFSDYRISGIGREEFSNQHKNKLRSLAHESAFASDIAAAHDAAARYVGRSKHSLANSSGRVLTNPLSHEARELVLFITSDGDLYRQQVTPIVLNLAKKLKKGIYDPAKAVKLWRYLADNGAKKYAAEFGTVQPGIGRHNWPRYKGYDIFTTRIRDEVARDLADTYMEAIIDKAGVPVIVAKA